MKNDTKDTTPNNAISDLEPDFSVIKSMLHNRAWEAWETHDVVKIMCLTGNDNREQLLFDNIRLFKATGVYEIALIEAYLHGPTIHPKDWEFHFALADREKLLACGDPVPSKPIKVFRGVTDRRRRRYIRGLSWTTNPNTAAWFATDYFRPNSPRPGSIPAVYSLWVKPEQILHITNEREEEEIIIATWECGRVKRLEPMPESIKPGQAREIGQKAQRR